MAGKPWYNSGSMSAFRGRRLLLNQEVNTWNVCQRENSTGLGVTNVAGLTFRVGSDYNFLFMN
jgi:hypothetical protein